MQQPPRLLPDDPIPPAVLIAVAVLALLFFGGGLYLFFSGPFTGVAVGAMVEMPAVTVAVRPYQGSLLGIEKARSKVKKDLQSLGLGAGAAITVFPESPLFMRPLQVTCQVGFILSLGQPPIQAMPDFIQVKQFQPGRRLVVRVKGKGNFSGNKAYRAAEKKLKPQGLQTVNGERFEVKLGLGKSDYVEHWIPVK